MNERVRPNTHPYHKFLKPVAHDSTILQVQEEEDGNPESLRTFNQSSGEMHSIIEAFGKK